MQKNLLIFFIAILLLPSSAVHAQKIDSVLTLYSEKFPQEKLHLHFDKSVYSKGETIWFKAYIMTGSEASGISKNFYADWYDASGKLVAHNVYPVFGSSAKGQFDVPENYTFSSLHLRAYTRWMLNFDSSFLFDKDIVINQPALQRRSSIMPVTQVHFFPEGGGIVNGLSSKIAFLSTDQNGDPVNIKGVITNNKNEFIDSFATEHDGMGSFTIDQINQDEGYFISWADEWGKTGVNNLPASRKTGVVMQSQPLNNKIRIGIERSADNTDNAKTLYLLAHMNQQVLHQSKINLANRHNAVIDINTADLPTGVLQLTVFNAIWQPVAERVVFVNNHQYQFNTTIHTITKGTDKRDKNIIEIDVEDAAFANLSVSVTDAGLSKEKNTIISQFLLSDEIKGKITDPAFYFSNDEDSTRHFLDLVMLTHGWRRFKWDEIAQAKLPVIHYPADTDYIQLSGNISGRAFKAEENEFMTLVLSGKNSGKQIIPVIIEKNGSFSKSGFSFFDTVKVYYSFKQKKLAERTDMAIRSNIFSAQTPFLQGLAKHIDFPSDSSKYTREGFFSAEQKRQLELMSKTTLKNVTVYSNIKPKTNLDILNDKYTSGAFADEANFRGDIIGNELAKDYQDIFKYLEAQVPGLRVAAAVPKPTNSPPPLRPVDMGKPESTVYDISLRGQRPFIFVNEIQSEIDELVHMPMSEIAYVKVFTEGFVGAWQNGPGGVIAVYTRKGNEELSKLSEHDNGQVLTGYNKYKEFYSPKYSDTTKNFTPDTRTTLYWNPYILTNSKNHKVQLEFFNNDISKKLRVVLEGINANGKLTRVEKEID